MADLNRVLLIGRLGAKPEVTFTKSGEAMTTLKVATSHVYQQDGETREETEWHQVIVFGKQAEHCGRYLDKDRLVFIEGSIRTRQRAEGETEHEILSRRVDFLGGAKVADIKGAADA